MEKMIEQASIFRSGKRSTFDRQDRECLVLLIGSYPDQVNFEERPEVVDGVAGLVLIARQKPGSSPWRIKEED